MIIVLDVYSTKLPRKLFALLVNPEITNSMELTLGVNNNNVDQMKLECITEKEELSSVVLVKAKTVGKKVEKTFLKLVKCIVDVDLTDVG